MFHPHPHGQQQGGFAAVFGPIATVAGLVGAIILTPQFWPYVSNAVMGSLLAHYSGQTAFWMWWALKILAYPATYLLTRAAVMAALGAISLFTLKRLI